MNKNRIFYTRKLKIKLWVFNCPYSLSKSGLWPFHVWKYGIDDGFGIGFHWLMVADAHVEINRLKTYERGI